MADHGNESATDEPTVEDLKGGLAGVDVDSEKLMETIRGKRSLGFKRRFETACCGEFVDVAASEELERVTIDPCPECGAISVWCHPV